MDCLQRWADDPGEEPATEDISLWVPYAYQLLAGWLFDRQQRQLEHRCIQELKAAGVIR